MYRPHRTFVIEVEGASDRDFDAVFVVDGRRETRRVALPCTFKFHAREVSYRVTPSNTSVDNEMSGHMYTADKSIDFCVTGWSVGGHITSPKFFGVGSGDFKAMTYSKDGPGPEVTTP